MPRPVLAGALGDELLDPQAEARRPGRRRRTSACRGRRARARRSRARATGPGLVSRRVEVRAGLLGGRGALEQRVDRRADQRRGHEPEQRQRRVAPADVRVVLEASRGSRARAASSSSELPGSVIAMNWLPSGDQRVEVLEERQRLDRAARLGRDDEQRVLEVDLAPAPRGSPPGSVESSTCRSSASVGRAERPPEHLGREARAAHPEQHGVGEARRRRMPRANSTSSSARSSIASEIVSQPSRSPISGDARAAPQRLVLGPDAPRDVARCTAVAHARGDRRSRARRRSTAAIACGRPVSDRLARALDARRAACPSASRTPSMPCLEQRRR